MSKTPIYLRAFINSYFGGFFSLIAIGFISNQILMFILSHYPTYGFALELYKNISFIIKIVYFLALGLATLGALFFVKIIIDFVLLDYFQKLDRLKKH